MSTDKVLKAAEIKWIGQRPYSPLYEDIYFDGNGVKEFYSVHWEQIRLNKNTRTSNHFTIVELGFGSGLNFLLAAQEITKDPYLYLHYIGIESHPISDDDWSIFDSQRHNLKYARELRAGNIPRLGGWHRRLFDGGRVRLSLFHGDVAQGLVDINLYQHARIDAWFLDGFAPSKNPEMWSESVFDLISQNSFYGTTLTSFTSAGSVRKKLEGAGFSVKKIQHLNYKRHSLFGAYNKKKEVGHQPNKEVSIAGAGIAGCSIARLLAEQNIRVKIFDPSGIATKASRAKTAIGHVRLLGDGSGSADFRSRALYFSQQFLKNISCSETREAIQPAFNEKELNRILLVASAYHDAKASRNLLHFLDNETTKMEFGIDCLGALYFPDTHLVNIAESCRLLADHPGIEVINREAPNEVNFVACASGSKRFTSTEELEIGDIAGQLDFIGIPDSSPLKKDTLVHGSGYVIQSSTEWLIGSTYEQRPWSPAAASEFNIEKNRKFLGNSPVHSRGNFRAHRCVSSDRDPVIGELNKGQYFSTAHGSMGTISSPFAAELVVSQFLGLLPPLSRSGLATVAPDRFRNRQKKRGVKRIGESSYTEVIL